ncbi:hypothetical protein ACRAWD_04345 [Caulobacter segnis]
MRCFRAYQAGTDHRVEEIGHWSASGDMEPACSLLGSQSGTGRRGLEGPQDQDAVRRPRS